MESDLTQDQIRAFVGPNADYYAERWHRVGPEDGWQKLGWNWSAFLLTASWLLYRRMYRGFWIAMGLLLGCFLLGFMAVAGAVWSGATGLAAVLYFGLFGLLPWLFPILFGIYGSHWYYLHARREIGRLAPGGEADPAAVARRGGTNLWAAVLSAVFFGGLALWGTIDERHERRERRAKERHVSPRQPAPSRSLDEIIGQGQR